MDPNGRFINCLALRRLKMHRFDMPNSSFCRSCGRGLHAPALMHHNLLAVRRQGGAPLCDVCFLGLTGHVHNGMVPIRGFQDIYICWGNSHTPSDIEGHVALNPQRPSEACASAPEDASVRIRSCPTPSFFRFYWQKKYALAV